MARGQRSAPLEAFNLPEVIRRLGFRCLKYPTVVGIRSLLARRVLVNKEGRGVGFER
jgi:hypothetical protein